MIQQLPESRQWYRRVPAKLTGMSAARRPVRMCRPDKEQLWPVGAGVTVQPDVSSRAPDMQCSSKARVSRDTVKMMEIPPWQGWDISSSTNKASSISKASRMSSISQSSSSKR
jgi:hypothetical protein